MKKFNLLLIVVVLLSGCNKDTGFNYEDANFRVNNKYYPIKNEDDFNRYYSVPKSIYNDSESEIFNTKTNYINPYLIGDMYNIGIESFNEKYYMGNTGIYYLIEDTALKDFEEISIIIGMEFFAQDIYYKSIIVNGECELNISYEDLDNNVVNYSSSEEACELLKEYNEEFYDELNNYLKSAYGYE